MTKKRAKCRFIILAIVCVIGIVLSVCSFTFPLTYSHYNGFSNAIKLGLDLSGGLAVVYDCELPDDNSSGDLNNAIDATITRLKNVLYNEGYPEATVTRQAGSRIRIEVPDAKETDDIFGFLENPQTLYMTLEQSTGTNDPKAYITGSDVSNVFVSYDNEKQKYGVSVKFTDAGSSKFANLTAKAAAKDDQLIYIYLGEISGEPWGSVKCESKITGGSTFISGDNISTPEGAKEYAYNIMSGTFNVKLTLIENSVISATLGKNALLYGVIAGAIALIIVMGIMWWRYGHFGLLADVALVIYMILMLFFLQAIPFVQLTLPGIAGIILSLGMAVDGNIIIFERIKEEYAKGKKIPLAVKSGFKRAFWPIFDSNITTIITSIILYFLGTSAIKGFAITLLLGIVLSMFTTLVVTRFLVKWYLPLNSTKPEKIRLRREEGVVEITETEEVVVGAPSELAQVVAGEGNSPEIIIEGGDTDEK